VAITPDSPHEQTNREAVIIIIIYVFIIIIIIIVIIITIERHSQTRTVNPELII